MDDQNKKLKMEKLSPIPVFTPTALSDPCLANAWQATPKSSCQHRKDAYAIETTSSPEIDQLQTERVGSKGRARRLLSSRCKTSASKKPTRATPLLGLVSRKSAHKKNNGEVDQCHRLSTIDEDPEVATVKYSKSEIEDVSSPQKTSLDHTERHLNTTGPNMVFPPKLKTSPPSYQPITGIVMKKCPNSSQSFNESTGNLTNIGKEYEEELDDGESSCDADVSRIESFESPIKANEKNTKPIMVDDFQQFCQRSALSSNKCSKALVSEDKKSFEVRSTFCRKRKRALDFTSQTFVVAPTENPLIFDPEDDLRKETSDSPVQSKISVEERSESDNESVIEGTPKQERFSINRSKKETLGGFATCSSLLIEADTPPMEKSGSPPEPFNIEIHNELSNDALDSKTNDLKLIVLSHDSSDSEVETCAIDGETKKTILTPEASFEVNVTHKTIQSDESPAKMTKPFSEAVCIEVCGSPDSDAPNVEDEVNDEIEEDKTNGSSTQEFIDESEQVRPSKRRKKGSLMERAAAVIGRIEASSSLFDYEMKTGLRQNTGKFVSSRLVVCKRWDGDESSSILICKPFKDCQSETASTNLVALMVRKVPDASVGSVVSVHFPVTIVYSGVLQMPYVLVGNQLVVDPESPVTGDEHLRISDTVEKAHSNSTSLSLLKPVTELKVFPSNRIQLLSEAALCQNLIEEVVLILKVRHVVRICHVSGPLKVSVLCCDDELHFCWIEFTSERDMKRATALETLRILTDGSQIQLQGFKVVNWTSIDKKTRNLANYCSNESLKHDTIFTVQPSGTNWIVSSSGRPRDVRKLRTTLQDILEQKARGKRYLIDVESVERDELGLRVKDSSNQVQYIPGENSYQIQFDPSSAPFSLDAVYYYDGKIFSDEFTKIMWKI